MRFTELKRYVQRLGPGMITGASDDDPSGIGTYSQVGAQFGLGMLWTMSFSYPLMCAIQLISARIGRVTGVGIAENIRRHYSPWLLYPIVGLLFVANTINIGTDLAAMGAAVHLLVGGPSLLYLALLAAFSLLLQMYVPYPRYVIILKWFTFSLLAYVGIIFAVQIPWREVFISTLVPRFKINSQSLSLLVAVLGTTISPYLFFWQASSEAEEVSTHAEEKPLIQAPEQARDQLKRIKVDTLLGMAFSNVVAFFIILTTALVLNRNGVTDIQTADQAASALRPIAGSFAYFLFAMGIVGTGLLAVPVLAGSAALALAETMRWRSGLELKPKDAKLFYFVLALSIVAGAAMNLLNFNPIKSLLWAATLNGVVAVPVMFVMMLVSRNRKVMGDFVLSRRLHVAGWVSFCVVTAAVVGMFLTM